VLLFLGTAPAIWAQCEQPAGFIVTFRAGISRAQRAASVAQAGAVLRFNYGIINAAAVRVPNLNALAALGRDVSVVSITPDHRIHAIQNEANAKPPNTGGGGGGGSTGQFVPEGVKRVGQATTGSDGAGIGVAVVDTGIHLTHADLVPNLSSLKFDSFGGDCNDQNGHGTHVAGTVAAADNTIDVVGVAPRAKLYCGRALDASGSGEDSNVIAVLDWILNNHTTATPPIRVVNMSLGRAKSTNVGDDQPMHDAVAALKNVGLVVVVAAGNSPTAEVKNMVPSGFPEVIAVGSTTATTGTNSCRFLASSIAKDTSSYFTTDGAFVAGVGVSISAPGEDAENVSRGCLISSDGILSTRIGGGTTRMSGTSMASPHVAGIVARLLQKGFASDTDSSRSWLRSNADGVGTAPLDSPTSSYGFDGEREGVAKAP
jgi:subtilisin